MSIPAERAAAPVGHIDTFEIHEATAVLYLRLWLSGVEGQCQIVDDFNTFLGTEQACAATRCTDQLFEFYTQYARRPMQRHSITCKCVGADEACFAQFIASATEGAREDALMMSMVIVRADIAPLFASLGADFGLTLKRIALRIPQHRIFHTANSALH